MALILLVDDSADTREIYSTFLAHHGFEVAQAGNGEEGVRQATERSPDLIIMNAAMPVVDGLTAADALSSDPSTDGIPIIMCTGYVEEDGADQARAAGCDAYLEKPCTPQRLLQEVKRFLADPAPAGGG